MAIAVVRDYRQLDVTSAIPNCSVPRSTGNIETDWTFGGVAYSSKWFERWIQYPNVNGHADADADVEEEEETKDKEKDPLDGFSMWVCSKDGQKCKTVRAKDFFRLNPKLPVFQVSFPKALSITDWQCRFEEVLLAISTFPAHANPRSATETTTKT